MKLTRPFAIAAALVVALLGAALAGVVAHASANTKTINVTEKEYRLTLSTHKAAPGATRFVVKNTGKLRHAFAIAGPGMKTKKTSSIAPGHSATLIVTLKSGKFSVWCPMPGHAALGMKATVTVLAASGGISTNSTTTDTGGGGGGGGGWG
jgi:uncharacterized cupredoxin-like copper-binding protein